MSYFSMFVFILSCGSLAQASSFDPRDFGYSEEVLLNAMVERGATSYREAANILDREAFQMYQESGFGSYAPYSPSVFEEKKESGEEASLALIRKLKEEDKRDSAPKVDMNEEASLAYIRQLQEESGYSSYSPSGMTPTITYVDPESVLSTTHKGTLKNLFLSAQGYDNSDVHGFNKGWSKTNIGTVQGIFKDVFGEVTSLSMSTLKANILNYKDSSAIRNALAKLEAYGVSGFADAESGVANTLAILSQNWHIASTDIGLSRKFVFDESGVARNSRDFVIHSLLENAATGGGCSPGFAGRFVRDQLILLCVQGGVDGS